jgi:hypothetical protein
MMKRSLGGCCSSSQRMYSISATSLQQEGDRLGGAQPAAAFCGRGGEVVRDGAWGRVAAGTFYWGSQGMLTVIQIFPGPPRAGAQGAWSLTR